MNDKKIDYEEIVSLIQEKAGIAGPAAEVACIAVQKIDNSLGSVAVKQQGIQFSTIACPQPVFIEWPLK
jgi:hypothetical protein